MNPGRTLAIANNVFWEVIRARVLYFIMVFGLFFIGAMRLIPEYAVLTEDKILLDLGIAAIGILGLIVAAFVGTAPIQNEIENRTVLVLLAKPISRAEFIVGKHLGLCAVLAVLITVTMALYLGLMSLSQIDYPLLSLLVAAFYLFLELSLLTAVAIALSVFTSSLLATLLTFAVYVMGHLSEDIVTAGELSKSPTVEAITRGLYLILPDLSRLDLKNQAVYGILPDGGTLLLNFIYALFYIILLLAIANLIFSRREF